jgi:hypothetical protein
MEVLVSGMSIRPYRMFSWLRWHVVVEVEVEVEARNV